MYLDMEFTYFLLNKSLRQSSFPFPNKQVLGFKIAL